MANVFIALRNFYGRCFHRPKKKHIAKFMFHCHSRERNSNMADAHIIALRKTWPMSYAIALSKIHTDAR